jgi:chitin disaccharide deacetylase
MLRLIVNADDLGLTEEVNEGILCAHRNGIVTSSSLMAVGEAFDDAVARCNQVPGLDLGVHLTLVEERPCLDPDVIPTLVDSTGRFHRHAILFAKKYFAGQISVEEVERELEAQVEKVLSRGISISHLDSHQHVHMLPQISAIVMKLARQHDIPAIRVPYEPIRPYMLRGSGALSRLLQLAILNCFSTLARSRINCRVDHVVGFHTSGRLDQNKLKNLLDALPGNGICELMCHPGVRDPFSPYLHWGYHWQDELEALIHPEIKKYCHHKKIRLVSYRELANQSEGRAA